MEQCRAWQEYAPQALCSQGADMQQSHDALQRPPSVQDSWMQRKMPIGWLSREPLPHPLPSHTWEYRATGHVFSFHYMPGGSHFSCAGRFSACCTPAGTESRPTPGRSATRGRFWHWLHFRKGALGTVPYPNHGLSKLQQLITVPSTLALPGCATFGTTSGGALLQRRSWRVSPSPQPWFITCKNKKANFLKYPDTSSTTYNFLFCTLPLDL